MCFDCVQDNTQSVGRISHSCGRSIILNTQCKCASIGVCHSRQSLSNILRHITRGTTLQYTTNPFITGFTFKKLPL